MQMMSGDVFSIPSSVLGFVNNQDHHQNDSTSSNLNNPNKVINPIPATGAKKRRNLPGTPDPDAEVIALSPKTLMATNRFICEVCNKGFQRDQNLQLHRRGHNLPWKLKQRTNKEVKKKVYICPERTCVHHEPGRALGDLTGIKKHFSRKHGEKKWKCEKCSKTISKDDFCLCDTSNSICYLICYSHWRWSKKYAVQSDWKAHSKTCGTREYKCDCGTLFSRKDSFITHRAFCDALADESARLNSVISSPALHFGNDDSMINNEATMMNPQSGFCHGFSFRGGQDQFCGMSQMNSGLRQDFNGLPEMMQMPTSSSNLYGSSPMANYGNCSNYPQWGDKMSANANLSLSPLTHGFKEEEGGHNIGLTCQNQMKSNPSMPMSATALLQKAAQIGSTQSNSSNRLFGTRTLGVMSSSSPSSHDVHQLVPVMNNNQPSPTTNNNLDRHQFMMTTNNGKQISDPAGYTRDFLGMGEGGGGPFLPHELAKFASIGSAMGLSQFSSHQ